MQTDFYEEIMPENQKQAVSLYVYTIDFSLDELISLQKLFQVWPPIAPCSLGIVPLASSIE